jgi:hypothetical protein
MILSRTLARRRIAAGVTPSFRAAWLPVIFDMALIAGVLALVWQPLLAALAGLSLGWTIVTLLLAIYLPFQIIAIAATIWAVRSRWQQKDESK